ncbi:YceI family protein [Nocardioides panzhihuensis]|uniref:Polyisoprenoid-binding protein YceI n=1 Tax=Nocardioides panzhihuensis TaxID=860243 RepID=A0A7Z0DKS6_9ACTN|nr:polyisoprenoid-binding protein YceI [Nocardioides panzhihuensis]
MRTRTKAAIGAGAAVVVVGGVVAIFGPGWYADRAEDAAADEPSLSASAAPADEADSTGTWTVSDGSYAGYRLDEVLRGEDVTVTGRTEDVTGDVTVADGEVTEASIEVKVATIATDSENRDGYFRENAIEADQFPTATFELTEPAALEEGATEVELVGDLTVHGETRPVTVDAEVGGDGASALQVVGSVPVTFADFGIEAPNLGFVSVEDTGSIEFSLELVKG